MEKIAVDVTGVRVTALITQYLRWLDSRDRRSILGDTWADGVTRRLGFDSSGFRSMGYTRFTIAARSRLLDEWVTRFLADNPGGIVVDLGSGFDSRVFRVDPGPGHHWYDVDFPDLVAVRDRLYPERPDHTSIGASVTEPGWLERIPRDRPVIVVADSVLMFLAEHDVQTLFRRITGHFARGELVFTSYSSMVGKREKKKGRPPFFEEHDVTLGWTLDDPGEVESIDENLRFVERRSQMDPRLHAGSPFYDRLMCAFITAFPSARYSGAILRYRFR